MSVNPTAAMITDEYPHADTVCPPPILLLADCYNQLRRDAIRMEKLTYRIAALNPDAGEIGAGMLAQLVADARAILNVKL